jgi:hypothetical protein
MRPFFNHKTRPAFHENYRISPEQYKHDADLLHNQPEEVLKNYRAAKIFMTLVIPSVSLAACLNLPAGIAASFLLSLIFFLRYRRRKGYKYALIPFICSMTGVFLGGLFLPRLISAVNQFKETLYGR